MHGTKDIGEDLVQSLMNVGCVHETFFINLTMLFLLGGEVFNLRDSKREHVDVQVKLMMASGYIEMVSNHVQTDVSIG